jgi:hypothetical protein
VRAKQRGSALRCRQPPARHLLPAAKAVSRRPGLAEALFWPRDRWDLANVGLYLAPRHPLHRRLQRRGSIRAEIEAPKSAHYFFDVCELSHRRWMRSRRMIGSPDRYVLGRRMTEEHVSPKSARPPRIRVYFDAGHTADSNGQMRVRRVASIEAKSSVLLRTPLSFRPRIGGAA